MGVEGDANLDGFGHILFQIWRDWTCQGGTWVVFFFLLFCKQFKTFFQFSKKFQIKILADQHSAEYNRPDLFLLHSTLSSFASSKLLFTLIQHLWWNLCTFSDYVLGNQSTLPKLMVPCSYMYHQLRKDLRGGYVSVFKRYVKVGKTKIRWICIYNIKYSKYSTPNF